MTRKTILGWDSNTQAKTAQLPQHWVAPLHEVSNTAPTQKHAPTNHWHEVVGKLRLMAMATPGAQGLFSLPQEAFWHKELDCPRLRLTKRAHAMLANFQRLARDVAS